MERLTTFSHEELDTLLHATNDAVMVVDDSGRYLRANDSPLLVRPANQIAGMLLEDLLPKGLAERCLEAVRGAIADGRVRRLHYQIPLPQGHHEFDAQVYRVDNRSALFLARDITTHRRLDAALAARYRSTALLSRISTRFVNLPVDRIHRAIDEALAEIGQHFQVDRAYIYRFEGDARYMVNSHGWRRDDLRSQLGYGKRIPADGFPWLMHFLRRREAVCIHDIDTLPKAAENERRTFVDRDVRAIVLVPLVYSDMLHGLVGFEAVDAPRQWTLQEREFLESAGELFAGALQRFTSEQRIFRLAYYDRLTELPNRDLQRDQLIQHVANGAPFGIVILDLDDSRIINDILGHSVGDHVLCQVASRLQAMLGPDELIGRWGSDEFLITLAADGCATASAGAESLHACINRPMTIDGHEMRLSCCTGSAHFPEDACDADGLIRAAEMALSNARMLGRGRSAQFEPALRDEAARGNTLNTRLRHALDQGDFHLHYQPQVRLCDNRIIAYEALLRLDDSQLGPITPDEFIPIAESSGLIHRVGEWVIRQVCADLAEWPGGHRPRLAINVSPRQLLDDSLPHFLTTMLARYRLPAELMELEITEGMLMEPDQVGIEHLRACRDAGMGIAVDDFGTGYSALGKLKHLPTNVLKIDRSFVRDIAVDDDDLAIVRAIVAMAHQLQLITVAEGVETEAQLVVLREAGCDLYQGYLFSRPVPLDEAHALWETTLASSVQPTS